GGDLRGKRGVLIFVATHANGDARSKEAWLGRAEMAGEFAKWSDVVENPEGTAVGCGDQIVLLESEIVNGDGGHVQAQRLPVVAVIEREVRALFGAGIQETFTDRVL